MLFTFSKDVAKFQTILVDLPLELQDGWTRAALELHINYSDVRGILSGHTCECVLLI